MNTSIRAVLFDLDDTLYEEMTFVTSGFRAVASYLSERFHCDSQELLSTMMAVLSQEGRGRIFDHVLELYGIYHAHLVDNLVAVYRSHQPEICLYPDVIPTFQALKGLGIKLGIITDGLGSVQQNKVNALGLRALVDIVICTDELGRDYWKPHPAAFADATKVLAVKAGEAIYVGNDPTKDFAGANNVAMLTAHLCRNAETSDMACEADIHISDLSQLAQVIVMLGGGMQSVQLRN